ADVCHTLAARAAVTEDAPVRPFPADVGGRPALVGAVVPLDQIRIGSSRGAEAGQFAGPARPLERAGEHVAKSQSLQSFAEAPGVALAALGQRQVGQTGV